MCIFCMISEGKVASNFVYQDEELFAIRDLSPKAPTHILIIPRKHIACLAEVEEADYPLLGRINALAIKLAEQEGIAESGYRLTNNCRPDSGQEVPHLHYHLLGGRKLGDIC